MSVAVSADGATAVSGGKDGTVRVWSLAGGDARERASLPGHDGWVRSVAMSADGATAVSGGEDGTVRVWSLAEGEAREVSSILAGDGRSALLLEVCAEHGILPSATAAAVEFDGPCASAATAAVNRSDRSDSAVLRIGSGPADGGGRALRTAAFIADGKIRTAAAAVRADGSLVAVLGCDSGAVHIVSTAAPVPGGAS
jgi:hypothetical protein